MTSWSGWSAEPLAAPVFTNDISLSPLRDSALETNAPIQILRPGHFQIGAIRIDRPAQTISFPAILNQRSGPIEYLLVTTWGKTHESLFRTDVEPYQLQVAFLLLGAKGAGSRAFPTNSTAPLPGDATEIKVRWKAGNRERKAAADSLIWNTREGRKMRPGPWTFTGSRVIQGQFLAQLDGSLIAVMEDEGALVNNPRVDRKQDDIWLCRSNALPALQTPVQLELTVRSR